MVASLATFFPSQGAYAADPGPKSGGCVGYDSVGYSSPFSKTKDQCLGQGQTYQYYQFAVKFDSAVKDAKVTAKSGSGTVITFVKQDDQTYVSQDSKDFEAMGYAAPKSSSKSACNAKDKIYIINITAKGNDKTQIIPPVNLCSYTKQDQSLIYVKANEIPGDNGTQSTTGKIRGNLGINREDPLVPDNWKKGTLEQEGVVSIKLSGKASKSGTNVDTWYSLNDGKLIIDELASGTYSLDVVYNDKIILQQLGGDSGWTSGDIKMSWKDFFVPPGGEIWLGNSSEGTPTYYNAKGDVVKVVDAEPVDESSSCVVEGIGWILCPVANAIAGLTDALFEAVEAFMKVAPLGLSVTDNPLYEAWSVMRSIANVAFVIAFLIIIFSQLTSAGVSNYGVKKLLPRLIVAAILVNLSYFICAIAVDLSNILGVAIQELFKGIADQSAVSPEKGDNWGSIITAVLTGGAALAGGLLAVEAFTAGGVWGALAAALPLLVGALFALVVAFLILLARQALIIMLIVLAPLAFVAYLLPNTENLYKKWQKLFMTLLLLFPMLSVIFGGSLLASSILRNTAFAPGTQPFVSLCLYIGSFAVQAIPFFITPLLISLSQGVLSRFAGLVNNKNKGPFDRLRKGGERIAKDAYNRGNARKLNDTNRNSAFSFGARRRANRERVSSSLEGIAKNNATDTVVSQLEQRGPNGEPSSLAMRMAGGRGNETQAGIIANKAVAAAEAEELKEALQPLLREISRLDPAGKDKYLKAEVAAGGARASASLHYSAQIGDSATMRDHLANGSEEVKQKAQEAINANANAFLAKAPDLVKGPGAAFGSVKGGELVNFKPDTAKAYIDHIRSLSQKAQALKSSSPGSQAHIDAEKKYQTAVNGFNSAVEDITKSVDLQGQFSGELGTKLRDEITSAELRGEPLGTDMNKGAAGILDDGKIR